MKALLITLPEHDDTTYYLSHFGKKIVEFATSHGVPVFDIQKDKVNRKNVESFLLKKDSSFVILNGHGSELSITGNSMKEILITAGVNDNLLKNKIVHAVSCKAGSILGQSSINNGAKSFIGYKEDFIFYYTPELISRPEKDETVKLFLEPVNECSKELIKGKTVIDSYEVSKRKYTENIRKLMSDSSAESSTYARVLWWDFINNVCLGDKNAVI